MAKDISRKEALEKVREYAAKAGMGPHRLSHIKEPSAGKFGKVLSIKEQKEYDKAMEEKMHPESWQARKFEKAAKLKSEQDSGKEPKEDRQPARVEVLREMREKAREGSREQNKTA